jgi:TonB family protein
MRLFIAFFALLIPLTAQDDLAKNEALLNEALAQNPNDANALTKLGLLKAMTLRDQPDELRAEAEPLIERALAIREQDPSTSQADLALALEAEAHVLKEVGREADASPLAARALAIRKGIVRGMAAAPSVEPVYRVGPRDGVSAPSVIQKTDPQYAETARIGKISGTVLLSVVVDTDGTPRDIGLVRGIGFGLDEKAAEALAQWRFRPGMMNGQPVSVRAQVEINFRLL